ncbi:MAG TPA: hypothetical protein VG106_10235, partial [Vicinamibacterales bacterium]|nr:hypothetical protein [Vicinamibacterales bacterium]
KRLDDYTKAKNARDAMIRTINQQLNAAIVARDAEAIKALMLVREDLEKGNNEPKPISTIGFHLNPQLLMWPAIYSCLLWVIFVYPPTAWRIHVPRRFVGFPRLNRARDRNRRPWLTPLLVTVFALLIDLVYQWPTWVRNALPKDPERKVFAYPNLDIHQASFWTQETIVFGFAALLALLWLQWTDYYAFTARLTERQERSIQKERSDNARSKKTLALALDSRLVNDLSSMFGEWQVRSLILALGFVFFTNFFWTLVARNGDQRYLVSAVLVHVLWAISWCAISIPLIARWRYWLTVKRRALVDLALYDRPGEEATKKEIITSTRPFSELGFSLAGAASFASFILPIVKVFF